MARKLMVVLGLVAALTLGSLATAPSRHAAQAAADSVALVWNEETLEAIRNVRRGPTVNARSLAIVHTAISDAWAAYDPVAVGTRLGAGLRQPEAERTQANKERAVSFAAYTAYLDLYPTRKTRADALMDTLGYAVDGSDTSTPAIVGMTAAQAVLDYRHGDGANQAGNYTDTSGYQPVNTWDQIRDADRWQPGRAHPTPGHQCAAPCRGPDPALAHRDPSPLPGPSSAARRPAIPTPMASQRHTGRCRQMTPHSKQLTTPEGPCEVLGRRAWR